MMIVVLITLLHCYGVRSMGQNFCSDLTDVTLAYEDTNSILTDDTNQAIRGKVAMWQCKWRHLEDKFASKGNGEKGPT